MGWLARIFEAVAGEAAVIGPDRQAALERWRALPGADLLAVHERTRYVVVDIEASGFAVARDRLIAIGAVAVKGGLIDSQDCFSVVLRQGVEPEEALLSFLEYIGKSPLVAYHAVFCQAMLARDMRRFLGYAFEPTWIDLAWVLPEYFKSEEAGPLGLDPWLARFGIGNLRRHDAVADCLATAQLLQVLLAEAAKRGHRSPGALVDVEKNRRWLGRDK